MPETSDKDIKIDLIPYETALNAVVRDVKALRSEWDNFQDSLIERLSALEALRKRLEAPRASILPINVKELAQLKQLGINPKDLLIQRGLLKDEKAQRIEGEEVSSSN